MLEVFRCVQYQELLLCCVSFVARRFIWNFFRLEAEHLNNVGEFRAVRDISLRPIKLQPKDEAEEEEDVVSSSPPAPQGTSDPLQSAHVHSSQNDTIKSLHVNHSPNTHTPVTNHFNVVIENNPTEILTGAAAQLELTATEPNATRKKVSKSTETLNKAADEIELLAVDQHDMGTALEMFEVVTNT